MSVLMRLQLGFPHFFSIIAPNNYYQFITMHGMIMVIYLLTALFLGGLATTSFADVRRAGHGLPLHEHGQLLGISGRRAGAGGRLFRAWRTHRAGWTLYPPQLFFRVLRARLGASF